MHLVILGDTHIPSRAESIPEWVREHVREADHVVHTGDFDSVEAHETIQTLASNLTAVRGNMDPDLGLPQAATLEVDGLTLVVTHGTGSIEGYDRRVRRAVGEHAGEGPDGPAPENAIGIAGHTHQARDEVVDGVRLLNPGSATGADPADRATLMTATPADGELDVTLHEAS